MPTFGDGHRRIGYLDTAAGAPAPLDRSRVLVLLHAFPLNAAMWAPQMAAVPPRWRMLAPDFRGFGRSAPDAGRQGDAGLALDDYAHDALALLDHLDIRRAVVAGLSMGGYVALALGRLAPERIAALVLADTKAEADDEQARNARREMIALVQRRGVPAIADAMMPRLLSERTRRERPDVEARVRALVSAGGAEGIAAALVRMMERPDATDLLASLDCPTLVVVGTEDAVTPVAGARRMQQRIPGARLVELPEAGHLSNVEQPALFSAALAQFLDEFAG